MRHGDFIEQQDYSSPWPWSHHDKTCGDMCRASPHRESGQLPIDQAGLRRPLFGFLFFHGGCHEFTHFLPGEYQIIADLVFAKT